jgi:hypothetical protein
MSDNCLLTLFSLLESPKKKSLHKLAREFENPYTLKTLFISLVRSKLEYVSCVWDPIYEVRKSNAFKENSSNTHSKALVGLIHLVYLPMKTDVA